MLEEDLEEMLDPRDTIRDLTAVILCGGQGTRLKPITGDTPKALALVSGQPFLHYSLGYLDLLGIQRAVLCSGYHNGGPIFDAVGVSYLGLKLLHTFDNHLGTGGALKNALPLLLSDPVLILNGDTFCPFDLEDLLAAKEISGFHALILQSYFPEAPLDGKCSGVYLVDRKVIEAMPDASADNKVDWDEWLKEYGRKQLASGVLHYHTKIQFHDIGTPEGYSSAQHFLRVLGALPQEEKEEQDGIQPSE